MSLWIVVSFGCDECRERIPAVITGVFTELVVAQAAAEAAQGLCGVHHPARVYECERLDRLQAGLIRLRHTAETTRAKGAQP